MNKSMRPQATPPAKSKLVQLIEAALKEDDRNQSWLADQSSISRQYISQIMGAKPHTITGKAPNPQRDTIIKIADALRRPRGPFLEAAGYSAEEGENRYAELPPKARRIMEMVGAMDDQDLELALSLVKQVYGQRTLTNRNATAVDRIGAQSALTLRHSKRRG